MRSDQLFGRLARLMLRVGKGARHDLIDEHITRRGKRTSRAISQTIDGTLARVVVWRRRESKITEREMERRKPLKPDSMPLTRLGAGYLYANASYDETSALRKKVS